MRKGTLLSMIFIMLASHNIFSQQLLSDSLMRHLSKAQVDSTYAANGIPVQSPYGLRLYRVVYQTQNAKQLGNTIASGLVVVPDSITCSMAVALYDHGTVMRRYDVPGFLGFESLIPMILATNGYYVVAPDYLGLGLSPGFHPYIHARSEAQAGIDMIFAAKQFASNNSFRLSDQLFLTGYSQGGHACMATHRAIQQNYAGQLTVTASAPGSGPYNVSGVQADSLADPNRYYSDPSYIPYIVQGYQSVYGNIYDSIQQFLKHPWDSILPPLFDGTHSTAFVDGLMPHHIDSFVVDSQLVRYNMDSANDPLRIDLRDNDVYDWLPQAPIMMTYCTADQQVIYRSTLFAYDHFRSLGDTSVYTFNGGALTHENCVIPYLANVLQFFSNYLAPDNGLTLTLSVDSESTAGAHNASVHLHVSGGTGYTISWNTGSTDSVVTGLHNGTYTVTVTNAYGCAKTQSVSTGGTVSGIDDIVLYPRLKISPNPANNLLNIQATDFRPETVTVYDINGQRISEGKYNPQLDVSTLSSGIYVLEVKSVQTTMRSKFVKM